jgi:hypothetical protein
MNVHNREAKRRRCTGDKTDTCFARRPSVCRCCPPDRPLVIFAGQEDDRSTLRTALSRLLGSLGILAVASLAVQALFGEGGFLP